MLLRAWLLTGFCAAARAQHPCTGAPDECCNLYDVAPNSCDVLLTSGSFSCSSMFCAECTYAVSVPHI